MAKEKYEQWRTEEGLTLLEGWARDGLTDEQIAHNAEINTRTLYKWKKSYPEISEALKKGKEVVDYEVENALLKQALGGSVTAIIFWLKNRRRDRWRDKPEGGGDAGNSGTGVVELPAVSEEGRRSGATGLAASEPDPESEGGAGNA